MNIWLKTSVLSLFCISRKEVRTMRLDKFLKVSRLIKRRTVANEACDAGRVMVNGKEAKASVKVNVSGGDPMEEKQVMTNHKLLMTNRKGISLTGILDVISFDLREILLETSEGMLTIKGNDLHINRLSVEKGDLEVEGRVDALLYSEVVSAKAMGESFLGRMFK